MIPYSLALYILLTPESGATPEDLAQHQSQNLANYYSANKSVIGSEFPKKDYFQGIADLTITDPHLKQTIDWAVNNYDTFRNTPIYVPAVHQTHRMPNNSILNESNVDLLKAMALIPVESTLEQQIERWQFALGSALAFSQNPEAIFTRHILIVSKVMNNQSSNNSGYILSLSSTALRNKNFSTELKVQSIEIALEHILSDSSPATSREMRMGTFINHVYKLDKNIYQHITKSLSTTNFDEETKMFWRNFKPKDATS